MGKLIGRWVLVAALAAAALAVALIAAAFFCLAMYLGFRHILPPWAAALASGGCALVVAGMVLLASRLMARSRRSSAFAAAAEIGASLSPFSLGKRLGEAAGAKAAGLHIPPGKGLASALLLGFAIGVSPRLRRFLRGLI
jgi:hypothetical protein